MNGVGLNTLNLSQISCNTIHLNGQGGGKKHEWGEFLLADSEGFLLLDSEDYQLTCKGIIK